MTSPGSTSLRTALRAPEHASLWRGRAQRSLTRPLARPLHRCILAFVLLAVAGIAAPVFAAQPKRAGELEKVAKDIQKDVEDLQTIAEDKGGENGAKKETQEGWAAFMNLEFIGEILVALFLSAILGAVIAYHPKTYRRAMTLEEVDQPKIHIQYAVVGAAVALIVRAYPEMAFVIFGIGGLLRFRTDVGPARDTGRVILATLIGLGCGLKIYPVAVITTIFGWVLIYLLESRVAHRMVVKGLDQELLAQSAEAYEEVLVENGLTVISQKKNFVKGQAAFVFRAPGELDREQLESLFKDIPPKLQGAVDWESS